MKLKVWHLNVGNHAGRVDGVANMSTSLANAQGAEGHQVRLWMVTHPDHQQSARSTVDPSVELEVFDSAATASSELLAALADERRPDIVHLHSVFRPVHALIAVAARRQGIPFVVTPHAGLDPTLLRRDRAKKSAYGWLVLRWALRAADAVIALQHVEASDIRRFSGRRGMIDVVANAAEAQALDAPKWTGGRPDERPVVIMLSRYDVLQKGLDRMVAMAAELPEVEFRIHGHQDKNNPEATDEVRERATPNVRFLPPIYDWEKYEALADATLFLLPSRAEGVSLALTEAMTIGAPCAVSSFVDRSLGLADRGAALALADEPVKAARQIGELLADRERLHELGAGAARYAADRFDPSRVRDSYLTIYKRVVVKATGVSPGPRELTALPAG